jgi:hypothetical protein
LTTIDRWSTMHPLQLKSPVDLSTNLAGQLPRFPAIFFVLAASSPAWLGASDWPADFGFIKTLSKPATWMVGCDTTPK